MTRTATELADAITRHDGLPLTDDQVRAQRVAVDLARWRARWPQEVPVPATLAAVPEQPEPAPGETREKMLVDVVRGDVLARAADVTTEGDALDLYVLVAGWGGEALDLSLTRSRKLLADDGTAASLLRSHHLVRGGDPVAAYESLWSGENKIKRFGPTAFTAWLYACGYDAPREGAAPLLLDHRVAAALGWSGARVSATAYGRYLTLAAETGDVLADRLGREVTAHAVQDALRAVGA